MFAPFFLDPYTYPSEQEACLLEVTDMTLKGSLNGGSSAAQSFYVEFDASLDVMNYNDLTWRNFIGATNVVFDTTLKLVRYFCNSYHFCQLYLHCTIFFSCTREA